MRSPGICVGAMGGLPGPVSMGRAGAHVGWAATRIKDRTIARPSREGFNHILRGAWEPAEFLSPILLEILVDVRILALVRDLVRIVAERVELRFEGCPGGQHVFHTLTEEALETRTSLHAPPELGLDGQDPAD